MKSVAIVMCGLVIALPLSGQSKDDRRSLLNNEPDVIYLETVVEKPIKLKVTKEAPVFSDKDGKHRLGFLRADQMVDLEAMTEKAYRVRGKGKKYGIAGWVPPWAFSHPEEDFVVKLKNLYDRQIAVTEVIEAGEIAIGMTLDEVAQSRGKPTKTSIRKTANGEAGSWEYIDYDEIKHYVTRVDPVSGQPFRQLSHVTSEETGKTIVEFKDGLVTALEENENSGPGNVRIIVPPLIFRW